MGRKLLTVFGLAVVTQFHELDFQDCSPESLAQQITFENYFQAEKSFS
jgi:hypothetical protein